MKRVMILGGPGAGKSTLAKQIHALCGLPIYHLDKLHWRAGWTAPPKDEWSALIAEIAAQDAWIMDGNYSNTFHLRIPRADTIIWLDLPRRICFPRVLKRMLLNLGRVREDVAPGCPERLDIAFLRWAWTFRRAHVEKYRVALNSVASHSSVVIIGSGREAEQFLHRLSH